MYATIKKNKKIKNSQNISPLYLMMGQNTPTPRKMQQLLLPL